VLLLSSRAQVEVDMMKVMRAVSHNVIIAQATRNCFVQTEFRTGVGRASRCEVQQSDSSGEHRQGLEECVAQFV
jgi:hypothetical protein